MTEEMKNEEEPVEKEAAEAPEAESDDKKPKEITLRSGLSKKDPAPSPPRRVTPEEIAAYLKAKQKKK